MAEFLIWPRMNRTQAEQRFGEVSLSSGPSIDLGTNQFDFDGVGTRANETDLMNIRDSLTSIASKFGFKVRHGYEQEKYPDRETAKILDREFTSVFQALSPMRWAESGSREVWSWFSLALLPDLTHWRWREAVVSKKGDRKDQWYKPRWIGSDLTRHTWARYWWRSAQFESDRKLLQLLNEHDFNHLLERADTLGANPRLMTSFGRQLWALNSEMLNQPEVSRRDIFDDSAKRMLRRLAYIDDISLNPEEIDDLVDGFVRETKARLLNDG